VVTLELPSLAGLEPRTAGAGSTVLSPDGQTLAVLRREHREPIRLAEVPTHLVNAVLTAEDRRFFDHGGVDARAIARAFVRNTATGEIEQGGSTITQQLVGLLYERAEDRTYDAKLTEALLARELEATRSKASILEEYLNTVYLGEGAYGVQAAAETYFRKDVGDLDVAESALLAAIIRAPSSLAPTDHAEAARWRRDDVLRRMAEDGHLSSAERDRALATPIDVSERAPLPAVREPHLVDLVVRTLLTDPSFGATEAERADRLYRGRLTVHTTVDLELQQLARETLARHLPATTTRRRRSRWSTPTTGHVLALTGNRSYEQLQFDLASQGRRQPGSTFKTFVLAAAIAAGHHPDELVDGTPGTIATEHGTWEVRNYDRGDPGAVSLAGATRVSVNAAFARLGAEVGTKRVAATARGMGVRSPVPSEEPQISLGGGELGRDHLGPRRRVRHPRQRRRPRADDRDRPGRGRGRRGGVAPRRHPAPGPDPRRGLRDHDRARGGGRGRHRASRRGSPAGRSRARPGRPRTTPTRGSSGPRRCCPPRSGSATSRAASPSRASAVCGR
jgi:membrane peptidoglycan carboxypeptidase